MKKTLLLFFGHYIDDMNALTTAPKFRNYEEFEEILVANLQIYEDFKTEFLKQVEQAKKT